MEAAVKNRIIKILATGGGAGLSPVAPGTAGTLVGVLICLLCYPMPWAIRLLFVIAISAFSIYVAGQAETLYGKTDDQRIVIDEIVGPAGDNVAGGDNRPASVSRVCSFSDF
ncbi:MAG: phosphatidylglycerophosphatase A [Desulfobacterales bacterium]|nr:phosphatidylglycerophosphatase A [Desulfobacterales bacterium]